MKIFAVRDESMDVQKDLAYLLYYEREKRFYVELPEDADEWETPLLLSTSVERGEKTVNSYWSKMWVQQRIVPPDRQNITQILKDNGLEEYDEFELLMLAMGRCAQDNYYLVPLDFESLPKEIRSRFEKRIEDVVALSDNTLLVFFCNGEVKKCELTTFFQDNRFFGIFLQKEEYFRDVRLQIGGHGVMWDETRMIADFELYKIGTRIPLVMADFTGFMEQRVVNSAEAAELLNCSRQYINELTKQGKLHPIRSSEKNTLYLKSELLKRTWK